MSSRAIPENRAAYDADRNPGRYAKYRDFLIEAKSGPCSDCGLKFPWYVMQFDHVPGRGPKRFSMSQAHTRSLEDVLAEIEKCDLVCANCHAIRTFNRS